MISGVWLKLWMSCLGVLAASASDMVIGMDHLPLVNEGKAMYHVARFF